MMGPSPEVRGRGLRSPGRTRPKAGVPPRGVCAVGGLRRVEGRVAQRPGPVPGERSPRPRTPELPRDGTTALAQTDPVPNGWDGTQPEGDSGPPLRTARRPRNARTP